MRVVYSHRSHYCNEKGDPSGWTEFVMVVIDQAKQTFFTAWCADFKPGFTDRHSFTSWDAALEDYQRRVKNHLTPVMEEGP